MNTTDWRESATKRAAGAIAGPDLPAHDLEGNRLMPTNENGNRCANGCRAEGRWAVDGICDSCAHLCEKVRKELAYLRNNKADFDPSMVVWPVRFKRYVLIGNYDALMEALGRWDSFPTIADAGLLSRATRWMSFKVWCWKWIHFAMRWVCRD